MAKKNEMVTIVEDLFIDLSPDEMVVETGKGKKKSVDTEATLENIKTNLAYYRGVIDAFDAVLDKIDGVEDALESKKEEFDTLYNYAMENYEDDFSTFAETYGIESFGGEEVDNPHYDVLSEMSMKDLKIVAKNVGVKVLKSDDEESLLEKLLGVDTKDMEIELVNLGYVEINKKSKPDSDDSDDEDEEVEDEDVTDYSELSLGELRKLCKENGIKYTPKDKAEDLIAKLEELDSDDSDDEDEEVEDEDVTEEELDEILDEEFEDEILEEEEAFSKPNKKGNKRK